MSKFFDSYNIIINLYLNYSNIMNEDLKNLQLDRIDKRGKVIHTYNLIIKLVV